PAAPAGSKAAPPAAAGRGAAAGGRGLGAMDIAQMLEMMPATKLEDLKPGETIVVSSTKGARTDEVTAIMFLANADLLIQIASASGRGGISQVDLAAAMAGAGGAGGLGIGGIVP
ncbi:MAG: hypothetical protein LAP87_31145, partial [Acidobacteriia bacterium]|nr:hypothetical protein [Terriglobia bacterium]